MFSAGDESPVPFAVVFPRLYFFCSIENRLAPMRKLKASASKEIAHEDKSKPSMPVPLKEQLSAGIGYNSLIPSFYRRVYFL